MFGGGGEAKQRRAEDDGKTGTGVNAKNTRVGKRIAGQGLHQRPGKAQRCTGQQPGKGSRQPRIEHNNAVCTLTCSGKGIDDRGRGQRFRADQQAECNSKKQQYQ
ncbi:hypothetical protein D3C72_1547740 [compost metagenome]